MKSLQNQFYHLNQQKKPLNYQGFFCADLTASRYNTVIFAFPDKIFHRLLRITPLFV